MLLAITRNNSIIRLESQHLQVSDSESGKKSAIPLRLLDRIICTDTPHLSGKLFNQILVLKIPVIFMNSRGQLKNIFLQSRM